MGNKLSEDKQYVILLDYIFGLYQKYKTTTLEINSSDLFDIKFNRFPNESITPRDLDFINALKKLEFDKLLTFQDRGCGQGTVIINLQRIVEKERKFDEIFPVKPETFNKPISITNQFNTYNFKDIYINIENATIENKIEIIQNIEELENEIKKETWNIKKIKEILKKLDQWIPMEVKQKLISLIISKLFPFF